MTYDNDYQDDEYDDLLKQHNKLYTYFRKKLSKKDYVKLTELLEQERELTRRE